MPTTEDLLTPIAETRLGGEVISFDQGKSAFLSMVKKTTFGVDRVDIQGAGAAYRFRRVVRQGITGTGRFMSNLGPSVQQVGGTTAFYNEMRTFPNPLMSALHGHGVLTGYLTEYRGVLTLDKSTLEQTELDVVRVGFIDDLFKGQALGVSLQRIANVFTPSATTRHICAIEDVVLGGTPSGSQVTFRPTEGNEMLLSEGQQIQFYGTDGTSVCSRHTTTGLDDFGAVMVVTGIDNTTGLVTAISKSGANLCNISGNAVVDGDIVVHLGQLRGGAGTGASPTGTPESFGMYGLVDSLVNTGNIFGLSTATFNRLKSFIEPNLGGPWTEDEADVFVTWYNRWHSEMPIDIFLITPGIKLAMAQATKGLFTADRTGQPYEIVGGHVLEPHVIGGRKVSYVVEPYQRKGTVIGLHMGGGNYEMLMQPATASTGKRMTIGFDSDQGLEVEVEMHQKAQGPNSAFQVVMYCPPGGGPATPTDMRAMYFVSRSNVWPKHLPGILVMGVSERNLSL